MKKSLFITIFILLFCVDFTVFGQSQIPPPAPLIYKAPGINEFKNFQFEDKTLEITFPGIPKISNKETENAKQNIISVYRKGSNSVLMITEYNFDLDNQKLQIFEKFKTNLMALPKSRIDSESEFTNGVYEGKEFKVLSGYQYTVIELLVVGNRIYQLNTDITNWHIIGEKTKKEFFDETDRFFNSLKINKKTSVTQFEVPEDFLGEISESSYKNTFLNFSLNFSKKWLRLENEQIEIAKSVGLDAIKTDKEKLNKAFEESTKKEQIFLALTKKGQSDGETGTFVLGVLRQPNNQITAGMVADGTKDFLLTNPNITLVEDVKDLVIDNTKFSIFVVQTQSNSLKIKQKIYITIKKGYSLSFVLSYQDMKVLNELEDIVETFKFTNK